MTAPASTTVPTGTTTVTIPATTTTAPATVEPSTTATVAPTEPAAVQATGDEPSQRQRRSLEDSLGPLDDDTKTFVLDAVKSARNEAKNLRDRAKSADDVRNEIASAVAKALGIEQPPDPATLTAQLTDQTSKARQAQVELAVFRAAATAGGDPAALLDSVSFVRALADIDPSDNTAIADKVRAAVAANPSLGTAPVRRVPGPNPAAGSSANGAPDLESEIAAAQKAGDVGRVISLQNQKLAAAAR